MNTGYILSAWIIVLGGLALYAAATIARGRRLARRVPPDRRRWADADVVIAADSARLDSLRESPQGRDRPSGEERGT
jgi:hypothetical protein